MLLTDAENSCARNESELRFSLKTSARAQAPWVHGEGAIVARAVRALETAVEGLGAGEARQGARSAEVVKLGWSEVHEG